MAIGDNLTFFSEVIAWTLLHSIWQGLFWLIAFVVLRSVFSSPARRFQIGLLCLAGFVLLQMFTLNYCAKWTSGSDITLPLSLASNSESVLDVPQRALNYSGSYTPVTLPEESWMLKLAIHLAPAIYWISLLWIAGFWLFLVRYFVASMLLRKELQRCVPLAPERIKGFRQLAESLNVRTEVEFLQTPELSVPATCGWLRPIVLLPIERHLKLSKKFMDAIILHELAHIRRRDSLTHRIRHLVQTVYFFHPLIVWIGQLMVDDSERAADEMASSALGDRKVYAKALLSLEVVRTNSMKLGATGGSVKGRLVHLITSREAERRSSSRLSILMCILFSFLLLMGMSEAFAHGASRDQRLLAWVMERDLPEAVLAALKIDTKVDHASPAINRALIELQSSGTVSKLTLMDLADSFHLGVPPDRVTKALRRSVGQRGNDMSKMDIPGIGTAVARVEIARRLTLAASSASDKREQAHLARTAYALLTLDAAIDDGLKSQNWILQPDHYAMLHLDTETQRRIDFAVSMHNKRGVMTGDAATRLNQLSPTQLEQTLEAISFLPSRQAVFLNSATRQDMELLRAYLTSSPKYIQDRWLQ